MASEKMTDFIVQGNIYDIFKDSYTPGTINISDGKISKIEYSPDAIFSQYVMPGFIDAHVHIESSMLPPSEFARLAAVHGTVACVSDPHEIANVLGMDGIKFMIDNSRKVPFKFYFGAPSCVPATDFETSGAKITLEDIRYLFEHEGIKYLSEMMNFPGVIYDFPEVIAKIRLAQEFGKPIDGHSPGLRGELLKKYIASGITTDHETSSLDEAIDKIYYGMKILIREGSAAKNLHALYKIIEARPDMSMFCSDDKHPDDLVAGHINLLAKEAISIGLSPGKVFRAAMLNPVKHYNLDVGLLRIGDDADFIIIDNPSDLNIKETYIKGQLVARDGITLIEQINVFPVNRFETNKKTAADFYVKAQKSKIRIIEAYDGELTSGEIIENATIINGEIVSDIDRDILKITVVNRYEDVQPSIGFIRNFGLKRGAIASSVGHDSHNITAIGTNDNDLADAVNAVIEAKGAIALADNGKIDLLPLPIAGLMSTGDGYKVAEKYSDLLIKAKELGSKLNSPFMTLSFMALLVIPKLKLGDRGLFDGVDFKFIDLQLD